MSSASDDGGIKAYRVAKFKMLRQLERDMDESGGEILKVTDYNSNIITMMNLK